MQGVVVGCDSMQQWLLPWWWRHYSQFSSYPVAFIDMGMTKEAVEWCKTRGFYIPLWKVPYRETREASTLFARYGKIPAKIRSKIRSAWLKKPYALKSSPFDQTVWIDLDCQVRADIAPLFHLLSLDVEIALAKDDQDVDGSLEQEVQYNSGVIATKASAPVIDAWIDAIQTFDLPGDQEYLSRAIFLQKTQVLELPQAFNWYYKLGSNDDAILYHFCGGKGKIEILDSLARCEGSGMPELWAR